MYYGKNFAHRLAQLVTYFRTKVRKYLLRTFGDKGGSVFTGEAHNLSFSKKILRITPDPDFRHFRHILV